ncbi:uncharacterized protein LOC121981881 isoform X3 [Zingiber officinale]|uniref:uncharacterized protein LOC121981881 isoform X3 n=1 Tax=Zingiber officinale TaxID=94328 RepID=UPI001C4CCE21|nr:uncharacterized protein LOC121981881 isoform X3 [Zingiber officinale]
MPGTIQVSVLELVEPPSSTSPTAKTKSSFSLKGAFAAVTLGKREYQTMGSGEVSLPVVSLRENLVVMLYGSDGKLISRTEFKTISVVEKGRLDSSFPLEDGCIVNVTLRFLLSKEEQLRVHELRNSKLRRKHPELHDEDIEKNVHAAGEKAKITWTANNVELKEERHEFSQSMHADGQSSTTSSADAKKYSQGSLRTNSYEQNGVDEGQMTELAKGSVKERDIFQKESSDLQREHETISTSTIAAKETTTFRHKLEDQRSGKSSLSRSPISNVRTMISVFESNPSEGLQHNVSSNMSLVSKNQQGGSLKRISSEESIEKKFISQTMAKSFSAEMLSDIDLQNDQRFGRPHLLKKQEEKQHIDKATKLDAVAEKTYFSDFDQKVKNIGSEIVKGRADAYFFKARKDSSVAFQPNVSGASAGMKSDILQKDANDLDSDNSYTTDYYLPFDDKETLHSNVRTKPFRSETIKERKYSVSTEFKLNHNFGKNPAFENSDDMLLRVYQEDVGKSRITENVGNDVNLVMHGTENQNKSHGFLKGSEQSRSTFNQPFNIDNPCSTKTDQEFFYCRFCSGNCSEQVASWTLSESRELLYTRTERYVFDTFGIWVPRNLCITTGSKQLRTLLESCKICHGSLSMEEKIRAEAHGKAKLSNDPSVTAMLSEHICYSLPKLGPEDVGASNLNGRLLAQGVRVIIVIIACGTLLLGTR